MVRRPYPHPQQETYQRQTDTLRWNTKLARMEGRQSLWVTRFRHQTDMLQRALAERDARLRQGTSERLKEAATRLRESELRAKLGGEQMRLRKTLADAQRKLETKEAERKAKWTADKAKLEGDMNAAEYKRMGELGDILYEGAQQPLAGTTFNERLSDLVRRARGLAARAKAADGLAEKTRKAEEKLANDKLDQKIKMAEKARKVEEKLAKGRADLGVKLAEGELKRKAELESAWSKTMRKLADILYEGQPQPTSAVMDAKGRMAELVRLAAAVVKRAGSCDDVDKAKAKLEAERKDDKAKLEAKLEKERRKLHGEMYERVGALVHTLYGSEKQPPIEIFGDNFPKLMAQLNDLARTAVARSKLWGKFQGHVGALGESVREWRARNRGAGIGSRSDRRPLAKCR